MQFINPRIDYAFKKIFWSEESKDILISFLNAILEFEWDKAIEEVEILDPYQAPKIKWLKDTFLDVNVTTKSWKQIIIEMQVRNVKWFDKRVLYNLAKKYSNQIEKWEDYLELNPVIALTITDFVMFNKLPKNKYISNYLLKEKEYWNIYNWDLELVFVELPKFKKELIELKNIQDKWIYFIKEVDNLREEPKSFQENKAFNHAFKIANQINLSKEELEELDKRSVYLQDKRWMIMFAEEKWEKIWLEKWEKIWLEKWEKIWLEKWEKIWKKIWKEEWKEELMYKAYAKWIPDSIIQEIFWYKDIELMYKDLEKIIIKIEKK